MSKKGLLIISCVVMILVLVSVVAVFFLGKEQEKDNVVVGLPRCVTVTFGTNAAGEKNFCWITDAGFQGSFVQFIKKESDKKPDFDKADITTVEGYIESTSLMYPAAGESYKPYPDLLEREVIRHRVFLSDLEADTEYWYRVGDDFKDVWSEVAVFKTAAPVSSAEDFSFLYVTDTQGFVYSDYEKWLRTFDVAYQSHPDADFLIHCGDFVEDYLNAQQWEYVLNSPAYLKNLTVVPVSGNKDVRYMMNYFTLGNYKNRDPQANGWYSFDYGSVHFTVLYTGDNDEDLVKKQLKWLKKDLEASGAAWKVVIIHKAPYSNANHADDVEIQALREQLLPVFDEYGVDMVIQGHDHYYFRSEAIKDQQAVETQSQNIQCKYGEALIYQQPEGTFYLINGSAGVKQYDGKFREMPEIHQAFATNTKLPSYTLCSYEGDKLVFYTYTVNTVTGERLLIEAFGIQK